MFTYIHSTTIIVSNQDAALDFYVNKLGWEKRIDNPVEENYRFLTVAPPGAQTELVLGPAHIHGVEPGKGIQSGISLIVDNIDETYRTLTERGVQFTQPPDTMPWGDRATWLVDPDGNTFFVNQPA